MVIPSSAYNFGKTWVFIKSLVPAPQEDQWVDFLGGIVEAHRKFFPSPLGCSNWCLFFVCIVIFCHSRIYGNITLLNIIRWTIWKCFFLIRNLLNAENTISWDVGKFPSKAFFVTFCKIEIVLTHKFLKFLLTHTRYLQFFFFGFGMLLSNQHMLI